MSHAPSSERADPTQPSADARRLAPLPPARSGWQMMLGACAQTLSLANPLTLAASASQRLDANLAQAIRHNRIHRFEALLLQARQPGQHLTPLPPPAGSQGFTLALSEAVLTGAPYYLDQLISAGADPSSIAPSLRASPHTHESLLHLAVRARRPEIIELLARRGARLSAQSSRGLTPLSLAASLGDRESSLALIKAGSPLDALDPMGRSALQLALPYVEREDFLTPTASGPAEKLLSRLRDGAAIASDLLRAGATARARPLRDRALPNPPLPPLASAIRIGDLPLIERLIAAGADASWLNGLSSLPAEGDARAAAWAASVERLAFLAEPLALARRLARAAEPIVIQPASAPARAIHLSPAAEPIAPASPPARAILASRRARAHTASPQPLRAAPPLSRHLRLARRAPRILTML